MSVTYISETAAINAMIAAARKAKVDVDHLMDDYYMARPLNPTQAEVERCVRETCEDWGVDNVITD